MKYTQYDEMRFRHSVDTAMKHIETILDVGSRVSSSNQQEEQDPQTTLIVPPTIIQPTTIHTYDDKFTLAEIITNTSIASQLNTFERLGLDSLKLHQIVQWIQKDYQNKPVLLRFQAEDTCTFVMDQEVEMSSGTTTEYEMEKTTTTTKEPSELPPPTNSGGFFFGSSTPTTSSTNNAPGSSSTKIETIRHKVVTKVREYHWKVSMNYRLILYVGGVIVDSKSKSNSGSTTEPSEEKQTPPMIELLKRSTETIIITPSGTGTAGSAIVVPTALSPIPERTIHTPIDVKINWLFQQLSTVATPSVLDNDNDTNTNELEEPTCEFRIQRTHSTSTRNGKRKVITPCWNDEIQAAELFNRRLCDWAHRVQKFLVCRIEKDICSKHKPVPKLNRNINTGTSSTTTHPNPTGILLEPGMIGIMFGLQKEPTFNGKRVRIIEYNTQTRRYKAEPEDPNSTLPSILSIKPGNINPVPTTGTSSGTIDGNGLLLSTLSDGTIFCPVLPLMEGNKNSSSDDSTTTAVGVLTNVTELLTEQCRTIDYRIEENLAKIYPPKYVIKLISVCEATICVLCTHLQTITTQYTDSINYIEHVMKEQLIAAIGKDISAYDFEQYMAFHYTKLFATQYQPKYFTYAIRRPGFYPDGILSIESSKQDGVLHKSSSAATEPIQTFQRKVDGVTSPSIFIPLTSATSIEITGDRYVHGWMQHRYLKQTADMNVHNVLSSSAAGASSNDKFTRAPECNIICRARQFSCFLLVLGTLRGPTIFEPKDAIIVKNKDDILIPLMSNILPSAKAFRDMISSLSPNQQAFAKAYRSMQLESSVFGVCIIQIKPQLEKLLNLNDCSLTKEIQLTQDLISLFIDYQIPSDIVSFDANTYNIVGTSQTATTTTPLPQPTSATGSCEKLEAVRSHVKAVMNVIEMTKEKQLKDEEMKADMRAETMLVGSRSRAGMRSAPRKNCSLTSSSDIVQAPFSSMAAPMSQSSYRMMIPEKVNSSSATVDYQPAQQIQYQQQQLELKSSPAAVDYQPAQPIQSQQQQSSASTTAATATVQTLPPIEKVGLGEDFTMLPKLLDTTIEQHDSDGSLCSTIIKSGTTWVRTRQENLLVQPITSTLSTNDITTERKRAYDLLDAISRSGTLPIACSELHIIVAVSHCFENDIMGSVIQDDINPIEKVERSAILLATAINNNNAGTTKVVDVISNDTDRKRIRTTFPSLL